MRPNCSVNSQYSIKVRKRIPINLFPDCAKTVLIDCNKHPDCTYQQFVEAIFEPVLTDAIFYELTFFVFIEYFFYFIVRIFYCWKQVLNIFCVKAFIDFWSVASQLIFTMEFNLLIGLLWVGWLLNLGIKIKELTSFLFENRL